MLAKWGTPSPKLRGTLDTIGLFTLRPMKVSFGKFKTLKSLKLINVPFASKGGVDYTNVNES